MYRYDFSVDLLFLDAVFFVEYILIAFYMKYFLKTLCKVKMYNIFLHTSIMIFEV